MSDLRTTDPEHEGWRDMSDRDLLSYAWSVLGSAERELPHTSIVWVEVATAVGHLGRRIATPPGSIVITEEQLVAAILAVSIAEPGLISDADMMNEPTENAIQPAAAAIFRELRR